MGCWLRGLGVEREIMVSVWKDSPELWGSGGRLRSRNRDVWCRGAPQYIRNVCLQVTHCLWASTTVSGPSYHVLPSLTPHPLSPLPSIPAYLRGS